MTKYGQTTKHTAKDHVEDLKKYIGEVQLDVVLVNKKIPKKKTLAWYKDIDEHLVEDDLGDESEFQVIRRNLIKDVVLDVEPSDSLRRSIIRHDSEKLAKVIMEILSQ